MLGENEDRPSLDFYSLNRAEQQNTMKAIFVIRHLEEAKISKFRLSIKMKEIINVTYAEMTSDQRRKYETYAYNLPFERVQDILTWWRSLREK